MAILRYIPQIPEAFLKAYQQSQEDIQKHAETFQKANQSIVNDVVANFSNSFYQTLVQDAYKSIETTQKVLKANLEVYFEPSPTQAVSTKQSGQASVTAPDIISLEQPNHTQNTPVSKIVPVAQLSPVILETATPLKLLNQRYPESLEQQLSALVPNDKKHGVLFKLAKHLILNGRIHNWYLAACIVPTIVRHGKRRKFTKDEYGGREEYYNAIIKNRFKTLKPLFEKYGYTIKQGKLYSEVVPTNRTHSKHFQLQ